MTPSVATAERRLDARHPVQRPVKIQPEGGWRYYPGRTVNLSSGGALLELSIPAPLRPGQRLRIGVAWSSRDVVLAGNSMLDARVVRSLGMDGRQLVAVAFAQRQELAIGA